MDSGDRSENRLTAPDTKFGGIRSQSFSNLFQGFFGVKPASNSVCDIPSLKSTKTCEGSSTIPTVSPSNDDSWFLSHFFFGKQEKYDDDDGSLKRNVTCSEFGKFENLQSGKPSITSSTPDILRKVDSEPPSRAEISSIPLAEESVSDTLIVTGDRFEKPENLESSVAKNIEQQHFSSSILSSFLMHDLPSGTLRPLEDRSSLKPSRSESHLLSKDSEPTAVALSSGPDRDQCDSHSLPPHAAFGEKLPEPKPTLRDFLWNFNHEKINVSRKEMNLMASIDH